MSSLSDIQGLAKSQFSSVVSTAKSNIRQSITSAIFDRFKPESGLAPSSSSAPGNSFAGMAARGDSLQNWSWYCLAPDINTDNGLVKLPWYYVQTSNLPQRNISANSIYRNGRAVYYPENYNIADLTLGLFLDTSGLAMKWIEAWKSRVVGNLDPTISTNQGGWGLPADYKKNVNIMLLSPAKQEMLNIKYINCYPTDTQITDLASNESNPMVLTVQLKVEDIDISVITDNAVIGAASKSPNFVMGAISNLGTGVANSLKDRLSKFI